MPVRLRFTLRILVALLFLMPLFWMVTTAFHPPGSPLPTSLQLWPGEPTARNFSRVWTLVPMGRFMLNSVVVVAVAVPLTIVVGSWAGLGMARLPQSAQRRWVVLSLAILMVPGIALWSTRFFLFRRLGLLNTPGALIAPALIATSPFYVLMFYRAFRRIPAALYDAAQLESSSVLQLWHSVAMPLARPTTLGVAVLSFVFYWGDFISPLLYLSSERNYTLPVALQTLQQMDRSDWPLLMAAAVLATAVPVALFLLVQPYFARLSQGD